MPAYKVPCPRCGNFIMRDVAVCPFCQTRDPWAPIRCATCRTVIADPRWVVCPSCGTEVPKPAAAAAPGAPAAATPPAATPAPAGQAPQSGTATPDSPPPAPAQQAPGALCTGCGAPLAAGARFCTVCGTLAG